MIVSPNQEKSVNFQYGLSVIKQFLKVNGLQLPPIAFNQKLDSRGVFMTTRAGFHGIEINLNKCKQPVAVPGFSWSFTGYKADITPAGVLAHEIGHYIDWSVNWSYGKTMNWKKSKAVSSYEPNDQESFAETMRLFILNPDLLKQGSPDRYQYLTKFLKFKPVISDTWEEVLIKAHPKFKSAAQNWIKQ